MRRTTPRAPARTRSGTSTRSEEHTSELQSQFHLVCRLLLEKKKQTTSNPTSPTNQPLALYFFQHTATHELYTLSLHDALPISAGVDRQRSSPVEPGAVCRGCRRGRASVYHLSQ